MGSFLRESDVGLRQGMGSATAVADGLFEGRVRAAFSRPRTLRFDRPFWFDTELDAGGLERVDGRIGPASCATANKIGGMLYGWTTPGAQFTLLTQPIGPYYGQVGDFWGMNLKDIMGIAEFCREETVEYKIVKRPGAPIPAGTRWRISALYFAPSDL